MLDVSTEEITDGDLLRALLLVAAPLLVQNVVQVVQQVVDVFFLGRFGETAVAAVGFAVPVYALVAAGVLFLPFVGTQVVVSQRVGGDDRAGARRALATGLGVGVGLSVVGGAILYVGARPALALLTAVDPTAGRGVVDLGARYLRVTALGLPALVLSDTTEGGFLGYGDARAALYVNLLALAGNVVLDPVLIFGLGPVPRLGVRGAALATVLGYAAGFVLAAAMVARGRNGGMLRRADATIDRATIRAVVAVGAPVGAQHAVRQVLRIPVFVLVFVAGGVAGLAAYTVGARVATVAFVPASGLQQAAQSVVGQNVGAGNADRAGRTAPLGVAVAASALAAVGAVQWLVPGALAAFLAPELSGGALALARDYLRILAYGYPALGALYLFEAGFNGVGRSRVSFASTALQYALVRLPVAAVGVLALGAGAHAVFWAVTLSNVFAAVALGLYYRREVAAGMFRDAVASGVEAD
jgi:putative MATE family efflux protein